MELLCGALRSHYDVPMCNSLFCHANTCFYIWNFCNFLGPFKLSTYLYGKYNSDDDDNNDGNNDNDNNEWL